MTIDLDIPALHDRLCEGTFPYLTPQEETLLTSRESAILALRDGRYDGNRYTLSEIGTALGLSKERVRQVEKQARSKMAWAEM